MEQYQESLQPFTLFGFILVFVKINFLFLFFYFFYFIGVLLAIVGCFMLPGHKHMMQLYACVNGINAYTS